MLRIRFISQLSSWFEDLRRDLQSSDVADTVERADELIKHFMQQKEATTDACLRTVEDGHSLIKMLQCVHSMRALCRRASLLVSYCDVILCLQ